LNLRNRLIWIAVLTMAFAGVQLLASRRKAERELVESIKDKLVPLADECARSSSTRGALTLRVGVVPEGKLGARVERVELVASSAVQDGVLVECVRDHAKAVTLKQPLPGGPQDLELTPPVEPASS
jgi:hypothetical protein